MPHDLDGRCRVGNGYADLRVTEVRIRRCAIGHGLIADPLRFFTRIRLEHWWLEIRTTDDRVWFCAQFDNPDLRLIKHDSREEVEGDGIRAAGRRGNEPHIGTEYARAPADLRMHRVYEFMRQQDGNYNLLTNNCQHFASNLVQHFMGDRVAIMRDPMFPGLPPEAERIVIVGGSCRIS